MTGRFGILKPAGYKACISPPHPEPLLSKQCVRNMGLNPCQFFAWRFQNVEATCNLHTASRAEPTGHGDGGPGACAGQPLTWPRALGSTPCTAPFPETPAFSSRLSAALSRPGPVGNVLSALRPPLHRRRRWLCKSSFEAPAGRSRGPQHVMGFPGGTQMEGCSNIYESWPCAGPQSRRSEHTWEVFAQSALCHRRVWQRCSAPWVSVSRCRGPGIQGESLRKSGHFE